MADFTPTQGRYLAFIHTYTQTHGYPPAEAEIAAAICVTPPSVNQMMKTLERKGLILRHPGQARSLEMLIPEDDIPPWGSRKPAARLPLSRSPSKRWIPAPTAKAQENLYVLSVSLMSGPVSRKFANREISRVIEIRGDQTLERLHYAIFEAYDRWDEHLYEFQFGKRPFDPNGPTYGIPGPSSSKKQREGNAHTTELKDLNLEPDRVFGYWFDFGDDWYHQIRVERVEQAIPTVTYPRVIKRVGKSPPQYRDE